MAALAWGLGRSTLRPAVSQQRRRRVRGIALRRWQLWGGGAAPPCGRRCFGRLSVLGTFFVRVGRLSSESDERRPSAEQHREGARGATRPGWAGGCEGTMGEVSQLTLAASGQLLKTPDNFTRYDVRDPGATARREREVPQYPPGNSSQVSPRHSHGARRKPLVCACMGGRGPRGSPAMFVEPRRATPRVRPAFAQLPLSGRWIHDRAERERE